MKKLAVLLLTAVLCVGMLTGCGADGERNSDEVIGEDSELEPSGMVHLDGADAVSEFLDEVYGGAAQDLLPKTLETTQLDIDNADLLEYHTGITDLSGVAEVYISEPSQSSVAYSAVYIITNDRADANAICRQMMDNINPSKWVCVTAQKQVCAVFGNDVFFVMGAEDTADEVYGRAQEAAASRGMSVSGMMTKNNPV